MVLIVVDLFCLFFFVSETQWYMKRALNRLWNLWLKSSSDVSFLTISTTYFSFNVLL